MTRATKEELLQQYPTGSRIVLVEMYNDPDPVAPGTAGTVCGADNAGNIYVNWDNGRRLSLCHEVDKFYINHTPQQAQ